ncbi:11394_t:CDS:2 [Gigaspora rosea]|nr:11394_t:CDS:2 [Gigaspora rosea]
MIVLNALVEDVSIFLEPAIATGLNSQSDATMEKRIQNDEKTLSLAIMMNRTEELYKIYETSLKK